MNFGVVKQELSQSYWVWFNCSCTVQCGRLCKCLALLQVLHNHVHCSAEDACKMKYNLYSSSQQYNHFVVQISLCCEMEYNLHSSSQQYNQFAVQILLSVLIHQGCSYSVLQKKKKNSYDITATKLMLLKVVVSDSVVSQCGYLGSIWTSLYRFM